jgi:hypothetical protein
MADKPRFYRWGSLMITAQTRVISAAQLEFGEQ